jgi:hypothetical protein
MNADEDSPPQQIDERGETYEYDPATDRITFIKDSPGYKIRRAVSISVGVDIGRIETETQLDEFDERHHDLIMEVVLARAMSRPDSNLEGAWLKAVVRGDYKKAEAIASRLKRRRAIGLRVVNGNSR